MAEMDGIDLVTAERLHVAGLLEFRVDSGAQNRARRFPPDGRGEVQAVLAWPGRLGRLTAFPT